MDKMSETTGGSKFWDGFCAVVGLADGALIIGLITLTPVSGAILGTASIGCAIYAIASQNK